MSNINIALIGKTGSGKSLSANTILGRPKFESKSSSTSITVSCEKAESDVDGRCVIVVDTPGLYDTSLSNEEVTNELKKCISLLAPGPHAFLLVMQIGRFTEEGKKTVQLIKETFGNYAEKYIMILFTRGDDLEADETTIEDYIKNADASLKKLIFDCGNRFHVFNNREKKDRTQVKELLEKISKMVKENGGSYYTNELLQKAEAAIQTEKEGIIKEKDEEIRRMREEMDKRYQQQIEDMKKQGESTKAYIQDLQQQHAKQVENMTKMFYDQARKEAEARIAASLEVTKALINKIGSSFCKIM